MLLAEIAAAELAVIFLMGLAVGAAAVAAVFALLKRREPARPPTEQAEFLETVNRTMARFSSFYEEMATQKLAKLEADLADFSDKARVVNESIPDLKKEFDELLTFYRDATEQVKEASETLDAKVGAVTGSMDTFQSKISQWEHTISAASAKLDHVVAAKESYDLHIINTFFKNGISEKILNYVVGDRYVVIPPIQRRMPWRDVQAALNAVEDRLKPGTRSRIRLSQEAKSLVMEDPEREFTVVQPCVLSRTPEGELDVVQSLEVAAGEEAEPA